MVSALKQHQIKTKRPSRPDTTPRMPHERDESPDSQAQIAPQDKMKQAYKDLMHGQVNTDLRGVQGVEEVTSPPDNGPVGRARKNAPHKAEGTSAEESPAEDKRSKNSGTAGGNGP
ncbi:MAG: hypothetical protein K0S28_340 [Paucimonas sp.]|jgi:hypothetical protein|nr:hypothetical protein [Paucimonas sp.]